MDTINGEAAGDVVTEVLGALRKRDDLLPVDRAPLESKIVGEQRAGGCEIAAPERSLIPLDDLCCTGHARSFRRDNSSSDVNDRANTILSARPESPRAGLLS